MMDEDEGAPSDPPCSATSQSLVELSDNEQGERDCSSEADGNNSPHGCGSDVELYVLSSHSDDSSSSDESEDVDLDHQHGIVNETAEPPSELIMPLLRYQKEWLAWALKQEESETKGGILADEMGMGSLEEEKETAFVDDDIEDMENSEVEQALRKEKSLLHSVKWDRIILDEAIVEVGIGRTSDDADNVIIHNFIKWALSGTPLQNRVGELYSLVRFLRIVPYSYYLCKDCDCRTLDYRLNIACLLLNLEFLFENLTVKVISTMLKLPPQFCETFLLGNKYISNPIQAYGPHDIGKRAMILLKQKVLRNIVLRRTKKGRAADLALPPRMVMLRRDTLDVKEEDYYQSSYNESQAQFNTYVRAGTVMNNYAHIFDLLTRLRQAVDHPYLVEYSKTAVQKEGNWLMLIMVTACLHVFCKACLLDFSASLGQVSCPTCSKLLTVDLTANSGGGDQIAKTTIKGFKSSSILNRIQLNDFQTSTKIEALREEIRFMVERDGSAKGIVFSQFTSFLDLISYSLHKSGVNCVQLVGSMSLPARDAAIKKFTEDPDCKIFLMSLKAGGVALNLTVASHVFLMDPWWNPAVERQAQDRIHRIGQYKPIRIVRFIIENTIEERILQLQEKKELVFEGTVGGSSEALGKLTEADLRFLFVT
ncbi:hypothetical protein GH714_032721 [Hevea brasiliensis]|uniref:Helicase C-terminal domain-containing protein n=1 Tax=Hevea brasiliensis TaxID=3981 RepID=A0A6A6K809_HEVBR|nr:hypothetical protein GH714_032721 [Hevea brasiliensis]